ncbi:MAG: tRNA (cytidine(34)-2'-O)-methyltransferase [Erysipelotrichaceae bacterium]|nr:tRNA (cytidine(34)-2'-O)-methyltransferase [Erysipelotrichaceae bacterium]
MIHVILFRPEKPLNTGNIMRTCMAVKAKLHIIGPISFSLAEKDLKRAGLDYIESLDYTYYENIEEFNKNHRNINIFYISRYGDKVYSSADFSDSINDIYVMFGRESTGIPHDILRANMDRVLRLPMVPNARSLNLSNCVAIVVYEILRQQNFNDLSTSEAIKGENFLEKELDKS